MTSRQIARRPLSPDELLPAFTDYIDELELLHDHAPPKGIDAVRATVEAELGAPLTELFSSFSETPGEGWSCREQLTNAT